uniref:Uncharacterized protein n=1 Tax=Tanacetum cinerariifolium TaxID=118510 RepID=A0A6L2JLN3_TANCI|nr:hypothetical protein [Tanacetum cinerariifolium]
MAYGAVPDTLDEYMQMGATTARKSLQLFCKAIMELYGWPWENCPTAFKAQLCRDDHGPDPFILLEAIASNDLWIWHAGEAISFEFFQEEQHRDDDPVRTHQESVEVTGEIINRTTHLSLKADLVEHIVGHENQH